MVGDLTLSTKALWSKNTVLNESGLPCLATRPASPPCHPATLSDTEIKKPGDFRKNCIKDQHQKNTISLENHYQY